MVRIRVRFGETDAMQIVHHATYPNYMEVARIEWLRRRGVSYATWAHQGMHLAVVELSLRYRAPARFDDELDVEAKLVEAGAASARFDYRIVRTTDSVLCVEGSTRLACVDDRGALRRFSDEMVQYLMQADSA